MHRITPGYRQRGQALIILFVGTLLLGTSAGGLNAVFGEHSLKSMHKELKILITEKERRQRLDRVLDDMGEAGKVFAKKHERQGRELLVLMSRHETAPAEFERIIGEADSTNREFRRTLLDLRDELRNALSPDEWRALFKAPGTSQPRSEHGSSQQ